MYITPLDMDAVDALDYMHKGSDNFVESKTDGTIYWINDLGKICKFTGFTDLTGDLKGEPLDHKDFPLDTFKVARKPSRLKNEVCPPPVPKDACSHNWKEVLLFSSIAYDCTKCGTRKEDL